MKILEGPGGALKPSLAPAWTNHYWVALLVSAFSSHELPSALNLAGTNSKV